MRQNALLAAVCVMMISIPMASGHMPRQLLRDALIGKWTATVTPDDASRASARAFTDTIEFKVGKFSSMTLAKQGFEPATYTDNPSPIGAIAQFSVTMTNKAGDTAKWTGTSTGKNMTGDLTITKRGDVPVTYTFQGSRP